MENVPRPPGRRPVGGCGGNCTSLERTHGGPEALAGHDRFVCCIAASAHAAVIEVVEALVFAGGPAEEAATVPGVPHPLDLADFVEAHQWPDPAAAHRLAVALVDLAAGPPSSGAPAPGADTGPDPQRCRRRP
ncbi:MAG: hypothetical protein JWM47_2402 [Acidimicrobiales bacterium]|nr:hypothetical protein [Acidimicrobiales bacterium]